MVREKFRSAYNSITSVFSNLGGFFSGMLGEHDSEIVELLRVIVELLRNGMSIEIINYLFKGSREFSREVIKAWNTERALNGGGT